LRRAFYACVYCMQLRFQSNYLGLSQPNQGNYFENATACSKRTLKTTVATELKFFSSGLETKIEEFYIEKQYKYWGYRPVFFNLGSAEPRGSANSLLGSLKMLWIVLYRAFRFRQMIRNFREVPRLEKGWKTLLYIVLQIILFWYLGSASRSLMLWIIQVFNKVENIEIDCRQNQYKLVFQKYAWVVLNCYKSFIIKFYLINNFGVSADIIQLTYTRYFCTQYCDKKINRYW